VTTRERVAALHRQGLSGKRIAAALGVAPATVSYHLRRLGVPAQSPRRYDWREVQAFYDAGHSVRECIAHFGMSTQTWHEARKRGRLVTRSQKMTLAALVAGRGARTNVKRRLIRAGLLVERCGRCGIREWQGRSLSLELHHVNGDGRDHRLENLELLCPNCHSQTDTWGGRNKKDRTVDA
jgi:hypothetical protein